MNRAQQQLVWSGAAFMALLAVAAAKEASKAGLHCKQEVIGWVDGRGRWVQENTGHCQ